MKKRVRIADSFAILADPRPRAELDAKYEKMRASMKARRPKPVSEPTIDEAIRVTKLRDRYGEPIYGFPRDRGFKPDQELLLDADLAAKWEADGKCVILEDAPRKAA
jgi:hypothetical protein